MTRETPLPPIPEQKIERIQKEMERGHRIREAMTPDRATEIFNSIVGKEASICGLFLVDEMELKEAAKRMGVRITVAQGLLESVYAKLGTNDRDEAATIWIAAKHKRIGY